MLGPDGFGGLRGGDGEITATGGSKVAAISRWSIRRTGTNPGDKPRLTFMAHFSWKSDVLMKMCQRGELRGRVRVFMLGKGGQKEQIDIVNWDEWIVNADGRLELTNIMHFDTAPLGISRGNKNA